LLERKAPDGCGGIVTNPPFKLVEQFVAHALDLCSLVVMLLRLGFYEAGSGKQHKHELRRRVLDEIPPSHLYVFRKRLPMMHRRGWDGKKGNSGMAFAWFVWRRDYAGPTTIKRISWER